MAFERALADPDTLYDRLSVIAGRDIFEPRAAYQVRYCLHGLSHFATDQNTELPLDCLDVDGVGNFIFTSNNSLTEKIARLSIHGRGNTIFLGADCRFPSLNVSIQGDGNIVYLGPFSNGGELRVDIAGDGHLIRVGQDAMLARARLSIGLGREIVLTDLDGRQISPVSGKPIIPQANIVFDGKVWVGREGLITEGVSIGDSAIVGSRSLVVSDLSAGSINTGAPARRLA